jgi:transposase
MRRTQALFVTEEDRSLLLSWLASAGLTKSMRLRARVVLASAGGQGARMIARGLGASVETVYLWRRRYENGGIEGLRSRPLPGRRRQVDTRRLGTILRAGNARHEGGRGHSVASVARAAGVSRATVRRLWERHGLWDAPAPPGTAAPAMAVARDGRLEPHAIVGIFIDLPRRTIARLAPTGVPAARPAGARAAGRVSADDAGSCSTVGASILTALEAFGGEARASLPSGSRESDRVGRALGRLRRALPGVALEILEGPWTGGERARRKSAGNLDDDRAAAPVRWVRARTLGEWLTRASEWLEAAPRNQAPALTVALGHLMDYFAVWSVASEAFVWTAAPLARSRARLVSAARGQPAG